MTEAPEGPDLEAAHIEYITGRNNMKDELYKALSKGYADRCDQLNAVHLIEELQVEVTRLRAALQMSVGQKVFVMRDGFSEPHETDASRVARAALAQGEADK
jgi:hypothetical protein